MANPLLVGPDTAVGMTNGTKDNSNCKPGTIPVLKDLGVHWFRWQPYAYSVEKSKGVYTWGNLDTVVSDCNANGINLVITVLFPPSWGLGSNGLPTPQWTLQYAQALCQRYDGNHGHGKIQAVELGNEDYAFKDDPVSLANTMNFCYGPLKSAYPNLIVGPGCSLHRNTSKITTFWQTMWAKAAGKFDYINSHYYCLNNNSPDPSVGGSTFPSFLQHLTILQNAASNAGHANFPIWITETGFYINSNFGISAPYILSQQQQSDYLHSELVQLKNLGQPAKLFFFTLSFLPGQSIGASLYQGVYGSGSQTIAYGMMKAFPKDWGGGTTIGTGQRDLSMRCRIRTGLATATKDLSMRARVKIVVGTPASKDLSARCRIAGGIYDTFVRSNQSSWGTASNGEAWVQAGGTAIPSIASNKGKLTGATGTNTMRLGAQTPADIEASVRFSVTQGGDILGITLRDTGLTTFIRLRLTATQLQLVQQTPSGGFLTLAQYAYSVSGNTNYWLKFRALGSTLKGKIWQDGSNEPDWLVSASTTITGGGKVGLSVALSVSADIALFDSFNAVTASQFVPPPTSKARDLSMRARVQIKTTTQQKDLVCRARIFDPDQITIVTYAALRPPLERRFPKS